MNLEDYSTEELRAELKRRTAEEKARKVPILRCRMCKHWGAITVLGDPISCAPYVQKRACKFWKSKDGNHYRCPEASELACEHFERKEE